MLCTRHNQQKLPVITSINHGPRLIGHNSMTPARIDERTIRHCSASCKFVKKLHERSSGSSPDARKLKINFRSPFFPFIVPVAVAFVRQNFYVFGPRLSSRPPTDVVRTELAVWFCVPAVRSPITVN
jgi:hypothetical protein